MQELNIIMSSTQPAVGTNVVWYNTNDNKKYRWTSSGWVLFDSANGGLTPEQEEKLNAIITNGDGTKYLSNDGEYKTITIPDTDGFVKLESATTQIIKSDLTFYNDFKLSGTYNNGVHDLIKSTMGGVVYEPITIAPAIGTPWGGKLIMFDTTIRPTSGVFTIGVGDAYLIISSFGIEYNSSNDGTGIVYDSYAFDEGSLGYSLRFHDGVVTYYDAGTGDAVNTFFGASLVESFAPVTEVGNVENHTNVNSSDRPTVGTEQIAYVSDYADILSYQGNKTLIVYLSDNTLIYSGTKFKFDTSIIPNITQDGYFQIGNGNGNLFSISFEAATNSISIGYYQGMGTDFVIFDGSNWLGDTAEFINTQEPSDMGYVNYNDVAPTQLDWIEESIFAEEPRIVSVGNNDSRLTLKASDRPKIQLLSSEEEVMYLSEFKGYSGQIKVNYTNLSRVNFVSGTVYRLPIHTSTNTIVDSPTTKFPIDIDGYKIEDYSAMYRSGITPATTARLRENKVIGQIHRWRIQGTYSNKAAANNGQLRINLRNPDSGFVTTEQMTFPSGTTGDFFTFEFTTIADYESLAVERGYVLEAVTTVTDANLSININSITRISEFFES